MVALPWIGESCRPCLQAASDICRWNCSGSGRDSSPSTPAVCSSWRWTGSLRVMRRLSSSPAGWDMDSTPSAGRRHCRVRGGDQPCDRKRQRGKLVLRPDIGDEQAVAPGLAGLFEMLRGSVLPPVQKVPGGGEAWRNGRMRFCRFTREYYLAVFDCMLRVLARNPALWDDLARAVGEKISEIRAEQLSSSSPPS